MGLSEIAHLGTKHFRAASKMTDPDWTATVVDPNLKNEPRRSSCVCVYISFTGFSSLLFSLGLKT